MNALPPPSQFGKDIDPQESQIWLPMRGENARWYARFCEYLAMGAARSFRAVYNAEKGNEKSKAVPASWSQATKRFEWQRRAEAYDAWRRREVFSKGNAQDVERVKKLDALIDKLFERVIASLADADVSVDKVIAQLLNAIDIMAKHTGGYAPQRHEVTGKDGGKIEVHSDEETSIRVFIYVPEIEAIPDVVDANPPILPEES